MLRGKRKPDGELDTLLLFRLFLRSIPSVHAKGRISRFKFRPHVRFSVICVSSFPPLSLRLSQRIMCACRSYLFLGSFPLPLSPVPRCTRCRRTNETHKNHFAWTRTKHREKGGGVHEVHASPGRLDQHNGHRIPASQCHRQPVDIFRKACLPANRARRRPTSTADHGILTRAASEGASSTGDRWIPFLCLSPSLPIRPPWPPPSSSPPVKQRRRLAIITACDSRGRDGRPRIDAGFMFT